MNTGHTDTFYIKSVGYVKTTLKKYRLPECIIDELTQETYIKFYTAKKQGRVEEGNYKYLCSIAHNEAKMHIVKKNSLKRKGAATQLEKAQPFLISENANPEEVLLQKEKLNMMRSLYAQDTHEVLNLFHFKEHSILEIADLLNIHPTAVKSRLSRARKKLKRQLKAQYG